MTYRTLYGLGRGCLRDHLSLAYRFPQGHEGCRQGKAFFEAHLGAVIEGPFQLCILSTSRIAFLQPAKPPQSQDSHVCARACMVSYYFVLMAHEDWTF